MKPIYLLSFLILTLSSYGQELPYVFSTFNEPYMDLVNPVSVNNGEIWDDPEYLIPLGFTFDFMGQSMTEIGIIYPGAQLIPVVAGNLVNVFLPYQSDIIDVGAVTGEVSESPISYLLEGDVGSRILKIEWKNVGFYAEIDALGTANNTTNFQLWLYETTNDIEYRFGNNTIKSPDLVHFVGRPIVGIVKNAILDGSGFDAAWLLDGDPTNPTIFLFLNSGGEPSADDLLDSEPPGGTVYHFDTGIVGVDELPNAHSLQLYPTLADGSLNVIWGGGLPATAEIVDNLGRIISSHTMVNSYDALSVQDVSPGNYFLRLSDGASTLTRPWFKK